MRFGPFDYLSKYILIENRTRPFFLPPTSTSSKCEAASLQSFAFIHFSLHGFDVMLGLNYGSILDSNRIQSTHLWTLEIESNACGDAPVKGPIAADAEERITEQPHVGIQHLTELQLTDDRRRVVVPVSDDLGFEL